MFAEKLIKNIMELYCIKTHPKKLVIAGNIYSLLDKGTCSSCGAIRYNVGVKMPKGLNQNAQDCIKCGKEYRINGICWFTSDRFIPIDSINIEEAIECLNETELINS